MERIRALYESYENIYESLVRASDISSANFLNEEFCKALLIACSSENELKVCTVLLDSVDRVSNSTEWIKSLIASKVTSRNYHSLFDWNSSNANQLFGMLGEDVKARAKIMRAENDDFRQAELAFMGIGSDRNRLVHGNYFSFTFEKTPKELYQNYQSSLNFINSLLDLISPE